MVVFSNRRLGARAELLVSPEIATALLLATAEAARPLARARWEHELIRWLERHAVAVGRFGACLDVADLAWTPEHFELQRAFVLAAIGRASEQSEHAAALDWWARLILAHPRDSVSVGRLWQWPQGESTI
jgi:hypothetical protein